MCVCVSKHRTAWLLVLVCCQIQIFQQCSTPELVFTCQAAAGTSHLHFFPKPDADQRQARKTVRPSRKRYLRYLHFPLSR